MKTTEMESSSPESPNESTVDAAEYLEVVEEASITAASSSSSKCCKLLNFDNNQEAKGWAFNAAAQGILIIGSVFLSSAMLTLANNEAGCLDLPPGATCENTVYGTRPSSLLTLMATISGFISSILMPITGSLVDHTSYRRAVAISTAIILLVINTIQICINESTWFFVAILQTINPIVFLIHTTVLFAYLSELTDDEEKLTRYNASFMAIRSLVMLLTLAFIVAISTAFPGLGDPADLRYAIGTARIAQVFMVSTSSLFLFFSFYKGLNSRPAKRVVPRGSSLLTTGFRKLNNTFRNIYHHYPAVMWNVIANILYMSVISSITVVAITYTTDFLKMNIMESGVAMFVFLFSAIFGSVVVPPIAKRFGLFRSLKASLLFMTILMPLTSVCISGPEQRRLFFVFAALWGISFGWIVPVGRLVYLNIMPKGQEGEMMGIYIFSSNGFVWLPPLVLTIMNENGVSIRIGIITLGGFTSFAFGALYMMGSYEEAVKKAKGTESGGVVAVVGEVEEKKVMDDLEEGGKDVENGVVNEDESEQAVGRNVGIS